MKNTGNKQNTSKKTEVKYIIQKRITSHYLIQRVK